jgi:hypothetical protein
MGLPKVIYDAGVGAVTLQLVRGPQNFRCYYKSRLHDNLATSGIRERVVEAHDILIAYEMQALRVTDDLDDWTAFMVFALGGGQCEFYPDAALPDYYHLVSDDEGFEPARTGPGQYAAAFRWRIVPDALAPADVSVVMKRFYGIGA